MNTISHSIPTQTPQVPVGLEFVPSAPTQIEDHNDMNHSPEIQALEAYLHTFGIPTAERSKLCLQVETRLQRQAITDSSQLPLSRLIQEAHRVITMEQDCLDAVEDTDDWIMASAEWRLRYWLTCHTAEPRQAPENKDEVHDFETLLIAPPIRRVSMPAASLRCNQWEGIVQFLIDKLTVVGASTTQTFRRLLANTLNG